MQFQCPHISVLNSATNLMITLDLFIRSLLWAGAQPTLDPSIENVMLVQCASPGRGQELVGVCGACVTC